MGRTGRVLLLITLGSAGCGGAVPHAAAPESSAPPSAASMAAPDAPGAVAPQAQPVPDGEPDLTDEPDGSSPRTTPKATSVDPGASPTPPLQAKPDARPLAAVSTAAAGKVGRGELEAVVAANLERFRPCATDDASVELEVTVSGGGSVTGVKALRSRPDNAKLRDCVVEAFRGIAFQRGAGSETSTITFELALNRPAF